jgi:RNA polymerase sigma factor (sigma-70 family)
MVNWESILAEHGSAVWRTVYRLLDHDADALDCYQETFLAAWRFARRQSVADWPSFLVTLATRRAMDRLRQRYRARILSLPIDRVPEPSSEADCPLRPARAAELMDRVRRAMAELPDKQAGVFWLSCLEGLSHQQIGDRMQIPPGEVRVLLHRARTRLGAILDLNRLCEGETMTDDQQPTPDPLEEALEAFRRMAVPDRPSDADVLAQLGRRLGDTAQPASIPAPSRRRYLMRLVVPSAAAAVLLAVGLGFLLLNGTAPIALADVVKAAQKYRLVRYKQQQTTDTKDMVGVTDSTVYGDLKGRRFRSESRHQFMDPDDREKFIEEVSVSVTDLAKDRHLMTSTHPGGKVLPPRKEAWLGRCGSAKNDKTFLENLRDFQQKKGVTSGRDKLDGRETVRYRLEEKGSTTTLWVDAATKLPVRMEYEQIDPTPDITRNRFVWTDYEWDPELPRGFRNLDELFSTTPPKGYTLDDQTRQDK